MWERRAADADFCQVRIGAGSLPPFRAWLRPTMDSVNRLDPVDVAALQRFLDTHSTVSNVPIVIELRDWRRSASPATQNRGW